VRAANLTQIAAVGIFGASPGAKAAIAFTLAMILAAGLVLPAHAQTRPTDEFQQYIDDNYTRDDYFVPMRDGVALFTVVYHPNDGGTYPILLERTPYGAVGRERSRRSQGPNMSLVRERYIIVRQEIRGTYESGGSLTYLTPHITGKQGARDVDESSDTWDTIDWLVKNIPNNNGRVGMWGIGYPGFCATAGMIDAHPALKAVSPQAPIVDYWQDEFFGNGAFKMMNAIDFVTNYGEPIPGAPARYSMLYIGMSADGYDFLLNMGPVSRVDDLYLRSRRPLWNDLTRHPDYDDFWESRNLVPHMKNVTPAVMTVGGWFDPHVLYGPLATYRSVEEKNPNTFNVLVMGPWAHEGWLGQYDSEDGLGDIMFGSNTPEFFQQNIELTFFEYFLKDRGRADLPEAYVFQTGANEWRAFDKWPPKRAEQKSLYCTAEGTLGFEAPAAPVGKGFDEFVSDPQNPVPFTHRKTRTVPPEFMVEDQRFAYGRKDVVMYETPPLENEVTIAGPITADIWVSTSKEDADWVVKLIDVYPLELGADGSQSLLRLRGYQMLVRAGVIRGRYRNDPSKPEKFVPGEPTRVTFELADICHTFKAGHKIMIQIQSSWFPYIDRNPQAYIGNIFGAEESQFETATHRVYRTPGQASRLKVRVLP
jgi:putative CocE/NonD family hydrolase